jgi:hypothetical protein
MSMTAGSDDTFFNCGASRDHAASTFHVVSSVAAFHATLRGFEQRAIRVVDSGPALDFRAHRVAPDSPET